MASTEELKDTARMVIGAEQRLTLEPPRRQTIELGDIELISALRDALAAARRQIHASEDTKVGTDTAGSYIAGTIRPLMNVLTTGTEAEKVLDADRKVHDQESRVAAAGSELAARATVFNVYMAEIASLILLIETEGDSHKLKVLEHLDEASALAGPIVDDITSYKAGL